MKKILITLLQLSVTIAVLYWVYHDPNRRAQMVEAIRNAQYRWVVVGILTYVVVEVAAAFRWHVLLKVQKIHLSLPRLVGVVPYRDVLQSVSSWRHGRGYYEELLPAQGNAGQESRGLAGGRV